MLSALLFVLLWFLGALACAAIARSKGKNMGAVGAFAAAFLGTGVFAAFESLGGLVLAVPTAIIVWGGSIAAVYEFDRNQAFGLAACLAVIAAAVTVALV